MISKAQIKNIRLLHQKKYRDEQGFFIAEGPKVAGELLKSKKFKVQDVFATREFKDRNPSFNIQELSEQELESISVLTTPNQILAVLKIPLPILPDSASLASELVLALDDIRDPGNLGTIIRIADWFGIHHILCSKTCVDVFNPKVIQATMGSIVRVNVYYVDLDSILKDFKMVYATVLDGADIYSQNLADQGVILIGNESKGVSEKLMRHVTQRISIPKFSDGADSLNAAAATAVICSEFRRKRKDVKE